MHGTGNQNQAIGSPVSFKPPDDLRDWLREQARLSYRSVSAQIVYYLQEARQAQSLETEKENAQPAATGQALVTQ